MSTPFSPTLNEQLCAALDREREQLTADAIPEVTYEQWLTETLAGQIESRLGVVIEPSPEWDLVPPRAFGFTAFGAGRFGLAIGSDPYEVDLHLFADCRECGSPAGIIGPVPNRAALVQILDRGGMDAEGLFPRCRTCSEEQEAEIEAAWQAAETEAPPKAGCEVVLLDVDRWDFARRLAALPAQIEEAEHDLLATTMTLSDLRARFEIRRARLLDSGEIDGKNDEIRRAQLLLLTLREREAVDAAELEVMRYRIGRDRLINELSALRACARLLGSEERDAG